MNATRAERDVRFAQAVCRALAEIAWEESRAESAAVREAFGVMMAEPGTPCLGRILDNLALDYQRPVAAAAVRVAALLR
jgi:hypothetical protein